MLKKVTCMLVRAILLMILCTTTTTVVGDDTTPIPEDISKVDNWFSDNIKPYTERKATLDPALVTAEDDYKVIKVMKNGGDFKTITDAINSIPTGNTKRAIIYIEGGVYQEKIKIERTKPFITFYGSPNNMPSITFAGTAAQYGTVDSATLIVESDYFSAVNVIIKNSAPKPDGAAKGAQAVAFRISGDKAAFYNCKIIGFQDTLCDDRGFHFFKDCHVEGTVDFIFGSGTSLYLNTDIQVIGDQGLTVITAHARENEKELTGYSFVHGKITGSSNGTYLGRAWKSRPRVVYSYTSMSNVVHPDGWSDNFNPQNDKTVFYGEYKCMGPGSNLSGKRVEYTKKLSDEEVKPFLTLGYILGSKWLLPPPNLKI